MKSLAREGDSDIGGRPGNGSSLVLMTTTLRPPTDSERNTIDVRGRYTA
ncbi:hypothetical protein GCM10010232_18730 [Streptomyces amakusaensis]|uniref:Uncharacterized protein n=1 Tax=Streptomyces inusitatus TaxID=68221 RepID=A0A918QDZ8_9ACTN|nr:hypothetical protein GCM10010387_39320 [Streptomyces inusitatus]